MALVVADRVQETTTTSGTGTLSLGGAVAGFQSFVSGIGSGNTTYYTIYDQTAQVWEIGIGTVTSGSPDTLSRDTVLRNSSGTTSKVNFAGNSASVFCVYTAFKSVNLDANGNVSPLGTISSGTWQGSTVGVAYGGTGVTASSGANSVVLRDSNQNISVNSVTQALTSVTASGGTTTLTAASPHFQILTGTGAHTFKLPDATTIPVGSSWIFDNDSTGNLTVTDYAGSTVDVVAPGGYSTVFMEVNGTVAGTWGRFGMIPAEVNWGTNSLDLGGSTVITNGVWQGTPVASGYGGTGLTTFAGANNALYSTNASTLVAGTLPVAAGGTGVTTTPTNGQLLIGNGTNYTVASLGSGTGISTTTGAGTLTINNTGVTSLAGTSPVNASASTGAVTVSLASGYGDTQNPYGSKTANYVLAAPNGSAGAPTFRALVAADIPTLSYVTSVSGTSPVVSSGGTTPAISLASGYGDTQNPYASKTANFFLAAPNGTAGNPTFRAIVAADVPTLNQNTTGTAANITASSNTTLTSLSSLATVGTITSGTWSASFGAVSGANLTNLTAGNLSGTIPSGVLGNSTLYVGTTAVALNRASANQALTGISSVTFPGSVSGTTTLQPSSAAGTTTITMPATTGTMALTSDIPSVGNGTLTMATSGTGLSGSASFTANQSGNTTFTVTSNATSANTASTIVARDASGNFSAGTITASLSGNASTASSATTAGSVTNSVTFNNGGAGGASGSTFNGSGALTVSYNTVGAPSTTGANASGTWAINVSGNAATATSATSATTATTATNWGSYGGVPAAGTSFGNANTIGRSDASGYTYFYYINSNTSNSENPSVSQVIVTNGSDNFYRKSSISSFTSAVQSNASGTWSINVTGSAGSATTATTASNVAGTTATAIQSAYQTTINTTTPGLGTYGIHFNGQTTADYASGITWNGGTTTTNANAGIYVQGSGAYGTKMYIATTDSYATGSKTAISIDHTGLANFVRVRPTALGNTILDAGNYNSYAPTLTGGGASGTWGINVTGTSGSISGYNNPTTSATANTIAYRDSGGDLYTRYFFGSYMNSTDDVSAGTITYIMAKFGDNYYRSATAAKVASFISGQTMNINGSSTSCSGNSSTATTATTANALNTGNNYQVNSLGVGTAASGTAGEIRATNNVTAYYSSDIKFKTNVREIPNALATVNAIGGKLFDWTDEYIAEHGGEDGYFVRKEDFGVVAQDVERVFPVAVRKRPDGSLAVDYEKLASLAFAALCELTKRIEKLEAKGSD